MNFNEDQQPPLAPVQGLPPTGVYEGRSPVYGLLGIQSDGDHLLIYHFEDLEDEATLTVQHIIQIPWTQIRKLVVNRIGPDAAKFTIHFHPNRLPEPLSDLAAHNHCLLAVFKYGSTLLKQLLQRRLVRKQNLLFDVHYIPNIQPERRLPGQMAPVQQPMVPMPRIFMPHPVPQPDQMLVFHRVLHPMENPLIQLQAVPRPPPPEPEPQPQVLRRILGGQQAEPLPQPHPPLQQQLQQLQWQFQPFPVLPSPPPQQHQLTPMLTPMLNTVSYANVAQANLPRPASVAPTNPIQLQPRQWPEELVVITEPWNPLATPRRPVPESQPPQQPRQQRQEPQQQRQQPGQGQQRQQHPRQQQHQGQQLNIWQSDKM